MGCIVISLVSASTSSGVISSGKSFPFWDISANVLVRSTKVSRPSVEDSSRRVMELWFDRLEQILLCGLL